jgi:hypothetical protein
MGAVSSSLYNGYERDTGDRSNLGEIIYLRAR